MAKSRRPKRPSGQRLSVVPPAEPDPELKQLRDMLAESGAPPELLDALDTLDGPGDIPQMLQAMIEAGLPSSPEEALAGILANWSGLLEPGTGSLDAELCGAEFLGMLRMGTPDEADLPDMLADMIGQAAATEKPEALAMLRVLAVLGPPQVRQPATEAADRLVATGLTDPAWVPGLGTPKPGAGFGYVDGFGAQELIGVTFSYGRKRHAIVVLIDYGLGGGVKDCFLTNKVDIVRSTHRQAARAQGVDFYDYKPAQAREILDQALAKPPCPDAPDQVEDVDTYLDLLRARVAALPSGGTSDRSNTVHRLKITLRGSKPPIWRRLEVPSGITLAELHEVIQRAFGWESAHLWTFETGAGDYGLPDPELGHRDAAARTLAEAGDRIRYTYDFGDNWEHDIRVERVEPAEPDVGYPRCLTGRRAGPPEDCGGIWGYDALREILADPAHPEHDDRVEWLGLGSPHDFDPAAFDLDEVNRALAART